MSPLNSSGTLIFLLVLKYSTTSSSSASGQKGSDHCSLWKMLAKVPPAASLACSGSADPGYNDSFGIKSSTACVNILAV